MCPISRKSAVSALLIIGLLAGCAGGGKMQSPAPMSSGGSIITIEAGSYKFSPNEIRLDKPGLLAIEVKNVSSSVHNFTLKDPQGKTLENIDLRPRGSAIVNVELGQPGDYRFYCNKFLHSSFGMKGRIVVGR